MLFGIVIVVEVVLMKRGIEDMMRNMKRKGWRYLIKKMKENKI